MRAIVVCFPPVYPPHPKSRNKLRSVALFPAYPRPSLSQRLRSKALRLISRYLNGCYQAPRLLAASVYQTAAGRHRPAAKNALMQQMQKALCALFVVLKIGKSKPKPGEKRPRNPCGKHYFAENQINKTIPLLTNLKSLFIFVRFYIDETTNISDKLR